MNQRDLNRKKLLERLTPFARGCFSGHVEDWPQLRPLLKDIEQYLRSQHHKYQPIPSEILPGQLFLDSEGIFDAGYDGEMLYVTCSKDKDQPWICMRFQEWEYGAQRSEFSEEELRQLKYVGELSDLRKKS